MAHSLRPWRAKKNVDGWTVVDAGNKIVAVVQREEDARLIEAAPDLLARVESMPQNWASGGLTEAGKLAHRAHGLLGA